MKDKLQYAIEKMKTQFEKAVAENDTSVVAVSYTHLTLPTICSV